MLDSVKTQIDYLEIIAANFIQTDNLVSYSNEKIVELNKSEKLVLKYNFLHVAISRNGGLIALCKQKDYFDQTKSRINNSIIILHQDATTRYFIPIDWDYSKRYVVNLEFNEKEQLFAFCSDGTIYKLDILTQKAIEIFGGLRIKPEGIHKAKLFEKGYIILTQEGTIYLVEDLKNPDPQFIISVKDQLGFTNDIDFIGIPARQTCSGKFEILITNQKGPGVLHVEKQEPKDRLSLNKEEDNRRSFVFEKRDFSFKGKVVHVSLMNSGYLEPYKVQMPNEILEGGYEVLENQLKSDFTLKRSSTKQTRIGNVTAMAISPTLENIALYVSDSKTVFYFSSQISVKEPNKIDKFRFELNPSTDNRELKIQEQILSFKTEQQLLFCGEENVAICGGKYIMMINNKNETIPILVDESEHNEYRGYIYCKCISEIDGIRYMTDKDIYLLSPVQKELNDLCNPFSGSLSRELINSYGNYISKNPFCHDQLKKIGDSLPDAIKDLAIAAANIYWTEKDPDSYSKRDVQNFMIKAAQFGKSIVQKEEFNFERFNDICKSIRIINNMRNYPLKPRYLTYNEYLDMNPDLPIGIINKTMRQLNFKLAYEICKFLGDDEKVVFLRYAIAKIKKLPSLNDPAEENYVYESLIEAFKNVENISYIEIAKKCIKYKKYDLAEKFLKNEKSVLVKIPQYLQLGKWNKALELSLKSCDLNVIKVVIDKIYKVEEPAVFNEIMASFPQAHSAVINYYKTIGKFDELNKYLDRLKDQEELLFISLENFFKSETLEEREKHLKDAKKSLSGLKTKDYGFYKAYISDLENSIKFKKQCFEQDKNIIETNDITTFDNSIYDCFQKAKADKYPWIETQNKKYFEISKRKMTILRFRNLLKVGNIEEVEAIIKKEGYKKLDISPLRIGRIFYEFRLNDKAAEYAKLETNPDLYDDKFNFLMNMEKYLDAVEAALSDKKNINTDYIYNVLRKKPDLKPKILELCEKYKVKI
jgi:hypothetical protein